MDHIDIQKHVRIYISVFVALAVLTVVTVTVSYLDLSFVKALVLAMIIASIKGALVACFFMHLLNEKQIIVTVLTLTMIFFAVLIMIPVNA